MSGDLIRLRNRFKLVVEGSLFSIIKLLLNAKSITVYFIWLVERYFSQKISNLNWFSFYYITSNFPILLLLHITFKGSRNIQDFALIRAVLFVYIEASVHPRPQLFFLLRSSQGKSLPRLTKLRSFTPSFNSY